MRNPKREQTDIAESAPAVFAGPYGGEVFCQKCGGNVNHNGCALEDCPVRKD